MASRRQWVVWLLVAVALGAPSAASAQGAGDEQYQDPFAPDTEQSEEAPESTPAPAPAPAPGGETSPSAPPPAAAPAPTATAAQQLPYTGADAGILAAGGVVLLAGGVALRLRVR
jgi:LPXTG-motif cell wall-anchored protein